MTDYSNFWDKIAERYAAQPVGDPAAFQRKKDLLRQLLNPSHKVLEVGSGTGSLALDLSTSAGSIQAIDFSPEMIRIAQAKQAAAGIHNVDFQCTQLEQLPPQARASYDSVWAFSLLHLVPERERVISDVFARLKPGGTFVSSNVCLGGATFLLYAIQVLRWFGKAPHVYAYDRETLHKNLLEAGFTDVVEHDVGAKDKRVAFVVAHKPA
jgi:arsenite methyltransferase